MPAKKNRPVIHEGRAVLAGESRLLHGPQHSVHMIGDPAPRAYDRPQGSRIRIVLDALWPSGTPPSSELSNRDLCDGVIKEFIRRELKHLPDRKSILREAGRLKR